MKLSFLSISIFTQCVALAATSNDDIDQIDGCGFQPTEGFIEESRFIKDAIDTRHFNVSRTLGIKTYPPPEDDFGEIKIEVVMHVVVDNKKKFGYMLKRVQDQFKFMNEQFASLNISFQGPKIRMWANREMSLSGMTQSVLQNGMICYHREGGLNTLNIFYVKGLNKRAKRVFNWQLPYNLDFSLQDAVLVKYQTMPGGELDNYTDGWSTIHGIGHWLGLLDTYGGYVGPKGPFFDCDSPWISDHIDDTPVHRKFPKACSRTEDSCPNFPGYDPTWNPMNNVHDQCITTFSPLQIARMRHVWFKYRAQKTCQVVVNDACGLRTDGAAIRDIGKPYSGFARYWLQKGQCRCWRVNGTWEVLEPPRDDWVKRNFVGTVGNGRCVVDGVVGGEGTEDGYAPGRREEDQWFVGVDDGKTKEGARLVRTIEELENTR